MDDSREPLGLAAALARCPKIERMKIMDGGKMTPGGVCFEGGHLQIKNMINDQLLAELDENAKAECIAFITTILESLNSRVTRLSLSYLPLTRRHIIDLVPLVKGIKGLTLESIGHFDMDDVSVLRDLIDLEELVLGELERGVEIEGVVTAREGEVLSPSKLAGIARPFEKAEY